MCLSFVSKKGIELSVPFFYLLKNFTFEKKIMNLKEKKLASIIEYNLTSEVSDMFARIRFSALLNLLVQSAIKSANSLGFGFHMLKKKNMTWMLGRFSLEIISPFRWDEKIFVETWPKTVNGLQYIRDFIVRDEKNVIVANGSSAWLAVNLDTKKLMNVKELNDAFYELKEKNALEYMPKKVAAKETDQKFDINATYYDLDINKHVTAVRYIDWMMDTFDLDFHENNYPREIHINYMKEIKVGDKITLNKKQLDDNTFYFGAKNQTSGRDSFKCLLKF